MKTVYLLCSYIKLYQQQRHLKAKQSPEKKKQQFEVRWSDSKPPSLQMNNLDNYLPWWNIFISAAIIFLLRWWEWGESAEEAGKTAITVSILLHNICFKKNEGNILGQVCNTRKESYCMKMAVSKNHLFKGVRSGILRRKETPSSQHTAGVVFNCLWKMTPLARMQHMNYIDNCFQEDKSPFNREQTEL